MTHRYVLKPQREGGGNNVYGDDIRPFLKVNTEKWIPLFQLPTTRRLKTVRKEMPTSSWTGSRYMLVPTNIKGTINVFQPPVTTNYMVRPGQPPKLVEVISELGIFGYVIGLVEFPVSRICFVFFWDFSSTNLFQEQGQDHNQQTGRFSLSLFFLSAHLGCAQFSV